MHWAVMTVFLSAALPWMPLSRSSRTFSSRGQSLRRYG
jgi:hypothetical protein